MAKQTYYYSSTTTCKTNDVVLHLSEAAVSISDDGQRRSIAVGQAPQRRQSSLGFALSSPFAPPTPFTIFEKRTLSAACEVRRI